MNNDICKHKSKCEIPTLSTTAYAASLIISSQLDADELEILAAFLMALAELLDLNAMEKGKH